jgi:CubicO group peptidase (beta-lactamase class C family)
VDLDADRIDALLSPAAAENRFSGVVRVVRSGEVIFENAYGLASRRWNVPIHAGMRFDVASITKLFTSVAVLQQVEAGKLDLDVSVAEWVDLRGTSISTEVTLRHLLTHTSGIADDADEEAGESYEQLWTHRPNYSVTETADFLPQFAHKAPVFAPGTGCRYCNCGYVVAGLALEAATGMRYRDYVTSAVFERAGMTRSGFFHMRDAVADVAEGWEPVRDPAGHVTGWRLNIYSYPPIGSPDGGAHVTAQDLIGFLDAVRSGSLLSREGTAFFLSPQVVHHESARHTISYGFGLEFEIVGGEVRSFSKDGVNVGASAMLRHYPASDVTVAVLTNSEDALWAPFEHIDEIVGAL